jgi:colicin import membrane protein
LLDHREPQRQVATAETLNGAASLGTSTGHAAHLSQSELEALRAKLISLWNPPAAISTHPDQYVVTIRIRLSRDHRLNGQPEVLTNGDGPLFEATRDSAVRAVFQAQPYDMLSQTTYDQWKEMDINFDPREVFGG